MSADQSTPPASMLQAAESLLSCYAALAARGEHLLLPLLAGGAPRQWEHYPCDDVIDGRNGYQYFYHSHSPEDRPDDLDHGHFHLFARLTGKQAVDAGAEASFLDSLGAGPARGCKTASLLCIGLDAKGVPRSLFTVNRWVTGDHLLSARATLSLLRRFRVEHAGPSSINGFLAAMIGLFWPQIEALVHERDRRLAALAATYTGECLLDDPAIELLSSLPIDIDSHIGQLAQAG